MSWTLKKKLAQKRSRAGRVGLLLVQLFPNGGATDIVFLTVLPPEGRPGMSDVTLLSGISGLSFDSPFLSPLLFFFCLVLLLFLSCHFFC